MTNEEALAAIAELKKCLEKRTAERDAAIRKSKNVLEAAEDFKMDKIKIARLTAERDAAIADLREAARHPCEYCKKNKKDCDCYCAYDRWEWRGINGRT